MTKRRQQQLRAEIRAHFDVLHTLEVVADALEAGTYDALVEVRNAIADRLERIDAVLLALTADRLADDRRDGRAPPADTA